MVVLIVVFMVLMVLARVEGAPTIVTLFQPECDHWWVFDPRAFECRQCGLCCEKHQPQDGCMSQGLSRNHSCISDAACTDPVDIVPAEHTETTSLSDFWKLILGIGIGLVVVVAGSIIGLKFYLRKRRVREPDGHGSTEALIRADAAATRAPPAPTPSPTPAAEDGETAAGDQEQSQDVEFSSDHTHGKLEAQPDSVGPRRPSGGADDGNLDVDLPNDELTNTSIGNSMETENSQIDTANQNLQTAPPNPGNQQSQGSPQNQQFSTADQTRSSNAASTTSGVAAAGVVDQDSSNLPEPDSENAQASSRRSTVQNNEYVPSLGGGDPDQTRPKTLE